ncbi:hypothetical protein J4573_53270 [Actinomadura barringtoniae]|uniref:Uncharacterized protein n=1 Tax=Actinomadura barringtoniae TaxID=1427535 RepID=A0A939PPC1_9ACTN|nr:hypothetical protein [Actinomadura barringtoniae]MBO2455930.1 hypothetical protein [Actinomadura barringtoniae]
MPRCTRCNAPLSSVAPGANDPTAQDPGGLGSGYGPGSQQPPPTPWSEPPPDPWSPRSEGNEPAPSPWEARSDGTEPAPPPGPSGQPGPWSPQPEEPTAWAPSSSPHEPPPYESAHGETSISLGREPWDEPEIWQPPPPSNQRRRSAMPYVVIGGGVTILVLVALLIIVWPHDKNDNANPPLTQQGSSETEQTTTDTGTAEPTDTESGSPTASADVTAQAGKVDSLLNDMTSTRRELGTVTGDGDCDSAGLTRIRDQRQSELGTAQGLDVSALQNGSEMKDALVRALQASLDSNKHYLSVAPDCPSEATEADQRATQAKSEFIQYWGPVADEAGLAARSADAI